MIAKFTLDHGNMDKYLVYFITERCKIECRKNIIPSGHYHCNNRFMVGL